MTTTTELIPIIPPLETTTTTTAPPSSSTTTTTSAPATTSSSTTSTTETNVLGSQLTKPSNPGTGTLEPGTDVLGTQTSLPPATIPKTGTNVGDFLLVAGVAILLGGLSLRYSAEDAARS